MDENVDTGAPAQPDRANIRNVNEDVDRTIQASSVVVIRDPNFESLRMLEISLQSSPNVMQSAKKMDINKLLEGLTEGDFESMSQT